MSKQATTIEQQINLLKSRNLTISDIEKANEVLRDIGYYRLGFYLFPFEQTYPALHNRTHEYRDGALFEDALNLYYFDFDMRLLLLRYLNRIEVAFRTDIIYNISNVYKATPIWYVTPTVVNRDYADEFENKVYNSDFKRNPIIRRHHQKYPNDRFAPAWKTIEFMTFGAVMKLYEQLRNIDDKIKVANGFGIRQVVTFESYMHTIRLVRNACAHGQYIYDLKLPQGIRRGPAGVMASERYNLIGALRVIKYIMSFISVNRAEEMVKEIKELYKNLSDNSPQLKSLLLDFSVI